MVMKVISVSPAVEATPDYSSDDVMGGLQTLAAASRSPAMGGILMGVSVSSKVALAVPLRIILFKSNPSATTFTENSALSLNAADYNKVLGYIDVQTSNQADLGTPDIATTTNINIPFILDGTTNLYAVCLARGTLNLGSTSDLTFNYFILQD